MGGRNATDLANDWVERVVQGNPLGCSNVDLHLGPGALCPTTTTILSRLNAEGTEDADTQQDDQQHLRPPGCPIEGERHQRDTQEYDRVDPDGRARLPEPLDQIPRHSQDASGRWGLFVPASPRPGVSRRARTIRGRSVTTGGPRNGPPGEAQEMLLRCGGGAGTSPPRGGNQG